MFAKNHIVGVLISLKKTSTFSLDFKQCIRHIEYYMYLANVNIEVVLFSERRKRALPFTSTAVTFFDFAIESYPYCSLLYLLKIYLF